MSPVVIWLPIAVVVAVAMDVWAAFLHGRVWHAWLWRIHASHHRRRRGKFELNDALSFLHAPIAIALVLYGARAAPGIQREVSFGIGVGMTTFGLVYLLVHDGVIHRRVPVQFLRRLPGMGAIVRAHRIHHSGAASGAPYGLLFGPLELTLARRRAARQPMEAASIASPRALVADGAKRARPASPGRAVARGEARRLH